MAKELKLLGGGDTHSWFSSIFLYKEELYEILLSYFLLLYSCIFTVLKSVRLSVGCNVRSRKIIYIRDVFLKNLK